MTVRIALGALDDAGVRWCIRNAPERIDDLAAGDDVDVIVEPHALPTVKKVLGDHGFEPFAARGHNGHDFFLCFANGRWLKLDVMTSADGRPASLVLEHRQRIGDVWVASGPDLAHHASVRAAGRSVPTALHRLLRALPLAFRRQGPVIAVLGPDGAGKGTVIDQLVADIPVGVTIVRLGSAPSGPATEARTPGPSPPAWREVAFVARKWLRAARRLGPAYGAAWRGHIVLCDRHPLEVLAVRPARGRVAAAVERRLLTGFLPRPDAVVVLDAPGSVLVSRKPEHPVETIERWRDGYRALPGAAVVRSDGPVNATVAAAGAEVWRALAARRGWAPPGWTR